MSDPTLVSNAYGNPYLVYEADRDPTTTEPLVYNDLPGLYLAWRNTSTGNFFRCIDNTSSAQVWVEEVDSANIVSMIPPATPRSFAYPSRSLNTAFQISSSRDAITNYSVDISATLSLTTGQTGSVFLEIADNSAFTTNVQELCRLVYGNTGSLTIGLNLTQNVTGILSGVVPAGKYVRLRTANTVGTPAFTYRSSQEVLL